MTLDEFLKDVREDAIDSPDMTVRRIRVFKLLAIIEAQRAELEKAKAGIDRVCSADDIEAGLVFIAMWRDGFGGNAEIARRFEAGEL